MSSVLFVSDAWQPQVNGVVRTLEHTIENLRSQGMRTEMIEPGAFRTCPCPTYPDIRLALTTQRRIAKRITAAACRHVHIATEGPLGLLAGSVQRQRGATYTTSYHTRFPEYVAARLPVPLAPLYAWLRRFHNRGAGCMVATPTLHRDLDQRGFCTLMHWPRGVDTDLFHPMPATGLFDDLPRPIWLNVGRMAVEKNLRAFLDLDLPGTKVCVGDGPQLAQLRRGYPDVHFVGTKTGTDLARHYAAADVFVFPSRTDTLGMVMLEALAAGLPVAAYRVMGPQDVVRDGVTGVLSANLQEAALACLHLSPAACRAAAAAHSWANCTAHFLRNLEHAETCFHRRYHTQGSPPPAHSHPPHGPL